MRKITLKEQNKKKTKKTSLLWLMSMSFLAVGLLLFCQFYFGDTITDKTTFYQNTYVNGVDISGLTKEDANNLLTTKFLESKNKINITLSDGQKNWQISGKDFEMVGNFENSLNKIIEYGKDGNIFQKKKIEKQIKKDGLMLTVSYKSLIGGLDQKIEEIAKEIEGQKKASQIKFDPSSKEMFTLINEGKSVKVNRSKLEEEINKAIENNDYSVIQIPFEEVLPDSSLEQMLENITLVSSYTTNYSKSTQNRKDNIKLALSKFNGMIVEPMQEVSFNSTTGSRTTSNGYKNAYIIFNGSYTSGVGGGVCQASSTLYNALLRADVKILQVNHHSLPASYVPLSFDAMVSEGYADLVFQNSRDCPIYIKCICTNEEATVEIYGQPLEDGKTIETRTELIKVLPHNGDTIIEDSKGEYYDKVLYKGEYYRLKFPQEGYETKGYIQYIKDGKVIEEKLVRHDHYQPQNGIIVEGTSELGEGMTLPASNVKYISPQKVNKTTLENAKKKFGID